MKAIETEYKGYRFRSRLEARWAVFFDACGVKWEYEPEGFDLGDGIYYLPDFLLHDVLYCHGIAENRTLDKLWVEVKGDITEKDVEKISKFANVCYNGGYGGKVDNSIIVLSKIPEGNNTCDLLDSVIGNSFDFSFGAIDGDWYGAFPCINNEGHFKLAGETSSYRFDVDEKATVKAYKLARQARFEHGQTYSLKI